MFEVDKELSRFVDDSDDAGLKSATMDIKRQSVRIYDTAEYYHGLHDGGHAIPAGRPRMGRDGQRQRFGDRI